MNKKNIVAVAAIFITLISIGCSGVSRSDCSSTDWKQKGVSDGQKGQAAEDILKTEKFCKQKNVDFPIVSYKEGWVDGIKEYCSPENGFKLSSKGKKVNVANCPIEYQPNLVDSIKKGEEYLKVQKNIVKLEKNKENLKEKREDVKDNISENQSELEKLKAEKEKMLTPESN